MEVAFVNAAATTADKTQMASTAGDEIIDRSLQVELMAFFHKWFYRSAIDITIAIDLSDAIAIIHLAIGTNGDPAKATVALN